MGAFQAFHKGLGKLLKGRAVSNHSCVGAGDAAGGQCSSSCRWPQLPARQSCRVSTELRAAGVMCPWWEHPHSPSGAADNPKVPREEPEGSVQDRQEGSWERCSRGKELAALQCFLQL